MVESTRIANAKRKATATELLIIRRAVVVVNVVIETSEVNDIIKKNHYYVYCVRHLLWTKMF